MRSKTLTLYIFLILLLFLAFFSGGKIKASILSKPPPGPTTSWSESQIRNYLSQYGYSVNKDPCQYSGQTNCTTLSGLGSYAVTGAADLPTAIYNNTGTYPNLIISGGTEAGHVTHGVGEPILDIAPNPSINQYVADRGTLVGQGSQGPIYAVGDNIFYNEGNHWHVIFGPSNGTNPDFVGDNYGLTSPSSLQNVTPNLYNDGYYPNFPDGFTFNNTLSYGSTGEDVRNLQKLLNSMDPAICPGCQIAETGPGSPGNETAYWGDKTEAAYENFQKAFANDVLYPASLTEPNGIFGINGRNEANSFIAYAQAEKKDGLSAQQFSQTSQALSKSAQPTQPSGQNTAQSGGQTNCSVRLFALGDSIAQIYKLESSANTGSGIPSDNGWTKVGAPPLVIFNDFEKKLTPNQITNIKNNGIAIFSGTNNPTDISDVENTITDLLAKEVAPNKIFVANIGLPNNVKPGAQEFDAELAKFVAALNDNGKNVTLIHTENLDRSGDADEHIHPYPTPLVNAVQRARGCPTEYTSHPDLNSNSTAAANSPSGTNNSPAPLSGPAPTFGGGFPAGTGTNGSTQTGSSVGINSTPQNSGSTFSNPSGGSCPQNVYSTPQGTILLQHPFLYALSVKNLLAPIGCMQPPPSNGIANVLTVSHEANDNDGRTPTPATPASSPGRSSNTSCHIGGQSLDANYDYYIALPSSYQTSYPKCTPVLVTDSTSKKQAWAVVGDFGGSTLGEQSYALNRDLGLGPILDPNYPGDSDDNPSGDALTNPNHNITYLFAKQ